MHFEEDLLRDEPADYNDRAGSCFGTSQNRLCGSQSALDEKKQQMRKLRDWDHEPTHLCLDLSRRVEHGRESKFV